MANPLEAAVAAARRRPALVLAVAGVGAAAFVVSARRQPEPPPATDAVATGSASPIAGYGAGLTQPLPGEPGDLYAAERAMAAASITNAIAAQTNAVVGAINAQEARQGAVQPLPQPTPPREAPAPTPPPVNPPAGAPRTGGRITVAEAQAALAAIGAPPSWATSGAWIRSSAADYVWQSAAAMQSWARRVARNEPSRGYTVDSSGRIVRR